jgi:hypothetical protein
MPKVEQLAANAVPYQAYATLAALTDHANNKNGLCFPTMVRLSRLVGCSVRTIQRHVHLLADRGIIEILQRRRNRKGRFSSYLYRVCHITRTTGHLKRVGGRDPIYNKRTKPLLNPKQANKSSIDPKDEEARRRAIERRRRTEGYEWLFS